MEYGFALCRIVFCRNPFVSSGLPRWHDACLAQLSLVRLLPSAERALAEQLVSMRHAQEHATTNCIPNNLLLVARGGFQQPVCHLLEAHKIVECALKVILPSLRNLSSLHGRGLDTFFVQCARRFGRRRGLFFYWLFFLVLESDLFWLLFWLFLVSDFNLFSWLLW